MRKILALTLALILVCAAGVGFSAGNLHAASKQVEFTRRAAYGDSSAIEDLALMLRTNYDRHLFWETTCRFADGDAHSDSAFSFSALERMEGGARAPSGVELATAVHGGMGDPDEPQTGLAAAYQQLYEQTPLGEERSRVLYLKDYYTDYPLSVHLDFPDYFMQMDSMDTHRPDGEKQVFQAFSDYFRIPVLADTQMEISVSRNVSGNSTGFGMGKFEGDDFYLWTDSVCTDDACYFAFDAHTDLGGIIDTGKIPGGYGIYRIAAAENDIQMLAAVQQMQMVYALDPEAVFLGLDLTQQRDALLLHTVENGMYTLTVIALDGMQTLQKLAVAPWPEESYGWQVYVSDDFLVVMLSGKELTLLSRNTDGSYTVDFTAALGAAENAIENSYSRLVMDYNGHRLALSGFLYGEEMYGESCGFYLAVYDRGGLRYYGEYASSLDAFGEQIPYNQRCFPLDNDAISISFTD